MPTATTAIVDTPIRTVQVGAYRIPTDEPESDGTLKWDSTTLVTVHIQAGNETGFGYTYSHQSVAELIQGQLAPEILGLTAMDVAGASRKMVDCIRNLGGSGLTSNAIAAVDVALWDLKARLLELPLHSLLGSVRDAVPIYGSGGFTSYSDSRLARTVLWLG